MLTDRISVQQQTANEMYYSNFYTNIMLEAVAVFTFAKCRLSKIAISPKMKKCIRSLSKYSFGIYLVHAGVIEVLHSMGINSLAFGNAAIAVPIITIIVFIISAFISFVLNHIPVVRKYFV